MSQNVQNVVFLRKCSVVYANFYVYPVSVEVFASKPHEYLVGGPDPIKQLHVWASGPRTMAYFLINEYGLSACDGDDLLGEFLGNSTHCQFFRTRSTDDALSFVEAATPLRRSSKCRCLFW
jgi:hypothetical protein